jgi:hypothetical protein
LAYAIELVELEDLQQRFLRADVAAGYKKQRLRLAKTPEDVITADAADYDRRIPGKGDFLKAALAEARKPRRARKHWSGLSRKEVGRQVAEEHPDIRIIYEVGDNFYGYLSVNTHPRLRWAFEPRSLAGNNAIVVATREVDRALPLDLALAAMTLAVAALTWIGRRVPRYDAA